jgi:hypothetical protein
MRKVLIAITLAAGVLLAGAPAAQAAPVIEQEVQPGDCGPGQAWTTYNWRLDREQTVCLDEPRRPMKPLFREDARRWWNPWSWIN